MKSMKKSLWLVVLMTLITAIIACAPEASITIAEKDIVYPTTAPADTGRTEDAKILFDDENTRIAEGWESDVCYRAEYSKTDHTVVVYQIVDEQVVETSHFDFAALQNTNQATPMALPPEGTVEKSDLGFGYTIGDQVNTFTCPYELVKNGIFTYQELSVNKDVEPDLHELFTTTVEDIIFYEDRLASEVDQKQLRIFNQVVLSCFGSPETMVLTTYAALSGVEPVVNLYERIYDNALDCEEYYFELSLRSIPPVQ